VRPSASEGTGPGMKSSSPDGDSERDHKEDTPDATPREIQGFYLIDFANSVYSTVGIGGFLPLLIQAAALANSGYPNDCPNVLRDEAELNAVRASWRFFNYSMNDAGTFYRIVGAGPRECDEPNAPSCFNGTCTGYPANLLECRDPSGSTEVALLTRGGLATNPTAYATLCITVSVVIQAGIFFFLGPLADYGGSRKKTLLGTSWMGASFCIISLAINAENFTIGMLVCVITNVCFGVSGVMMNAFLPKIVAALPEVRAAQGKEREEIESMRSTEISARGFAWGYVAGVIGIILCIPLVALLPEILAYQLCMVIVGIWWAAWMIPVALRLLPRPGSPLPENKTVCTVASSSFLATFRELCALPRSGFYLLLWAFFSDGVFLVGSIGGLYANSRVDWGCFPKTYGVLAVFILVPLFAAGFNVLYQKIAKWFRVPPERMLQWTLVVIGLVVPIWGFAGIATGLDVIIVAVIWGAHMGPMQAFSRSVFASLIPPGKESAFFALYELTNRGSSWLGPLILTVSVAATNQYTYAFVYVLVVCLGGAFFLSFIDMKKGHKAAIERGRTSVALATPSIVLNPVAP
jgi:UMF1 family MFS transporter